MRNRINSSNNNAFLNKYGINRSTENLHVHGRLGQHPVIGVDNKDQIKNSNVRENARVATVFVKQEFLSRLQKRNVNTKIDAAKAVEAINSSNIICSFGASIGDTDAYWWKIIGKWLKTNNRMLVIFDICGEEDDGVSYKSNYNRDKSVDDKREYVLDRFTRLAEWTDEEIKANEDKIVIEFDCELFNFKLPKMEF